MVKTFLVLIGVVFCVDIFIISAKEVDEKDAIISEAEVTNHILVDTGDVNKVFHFDRSELEVDRKDVECSEEQPCLNGGTCSNKRCVCPRGIAGDLCEDIVECTDHCQNRLELDCNLVELGEFKVYCTCKNSSLYYDKEAGICKPCSCENGYCGYDHRKLECYCNSGYKMFNGYCKECDCGAGSIGECEFDANGEKICKCFEGFYEREGRCRTCGCHSWSDMETKCEVTGNVKRCFCKEGYKDVFGQCEKINPCETNNTCHSSATCYYKFGEFYCECPEGYKGTDGGKVEPGKVCEDIDECAGTLSPCWLYDNVKCVNLPGSYKCECLHGYEPRNYATEPQRTTCVRVSKNGGPATIVVITTIALFGVSLYMHIRLRKRALRSN